MGIRVNFSGIYDKLLKMDRELREDMINEILDEGAEPLLKSMKRNCPVKTGELRDSLGVKKKRDGKGYRLKVGVGKSQIYSKKKLTDLETRAFYTNYGTRRSIGNRWMNKSVDESEKQVIEKMEKVISERLSRL